MAGLRLVVLVGLVGCGRISFDPLDQAWRLQARYYELDGLRFEAGVYDSLRSESCSLVEWSDGRIRCVPGGLKVDYTDPSCETPVGQSSGEPPDYFIDHGTAAEPGVTHVWSPGAARPLTQYYARFNQECQGPLAAVGTAYSLEEVSPVQLAEVELVTPANGERLAQQYAQEGPGAPRFRWHTIDTLLDERCAPTLRVPDVSTIRCLPNDTGFEQFLWFSDASCTQLASNYFQPVVPKYFVVDSDQCSVTPDTLHATTAVVPGATLYRPQPTCTSLGGTTGSVVHLGPAIDSPLLSRNVVPGRGRLAAVSYVGGGLETAVQSFYDDVWSVPCDPAPNEGDGTVRCLPLAGSTQVRYRDAACAMPIDLVRYHPCSSAQRPVFVHVGTDELHDIGARYTGPVYIFTGSCDLDTTVAEYYEVGPTTAYTPVTGTIVTDS